MVEVLLLYHYDIPECKPKGSSRIKYKLDQALPVPNDLFARLCCVEGFLIYETVSVLFVEKLR